MSRTNRAIAYCRGHDQAETDMKVGVLESFARTVKLRIVATHTDHIIVAQNEARFSLGGINAMLDALRRREAEHVLVIGLSEITGPTGFLFEAFGSLRSMGVSPTTVDTRAFTKGYHGQKVDEDPPPKKLPPKSPDWHIQALCEGRRAAAIKGRSIAGPAPFGYLRDATGALQAQAQEVVIVQRIFSSYLKPYGTIGKVANELNAAGIAPRHGKQWSRAAIAYLLKNPTYAGRIRYGEIASQGQHRAIISSIIFNKTQTKLAAKRTNRRA